MRPVSFAGLLRMLQLIEEFPAGLRARDLDAAIKVRRVHLTRDDCIPARTTLYHYRNTLLHLQALQRDGRYLVTNKENPHVLMLLTQPNPAGTTLNRGARQAFSSLVLQNEDCRKAFFNLFMSDLESYSEQQFRTNGCSVVWQRHYGSNSKEIILQSESGAHSLSLNSPSEIQSILYGLRYWARDELQLVDEFYQEDRGAILYPILNPEDESLIFETVQDIYSLCSTRDEWTTLSFRDLIVYCCEHLRRSRTNLFSAIEWLFGKHPGYVILIPTSRSLATLTARSRQREEFELRSYFRDKQGRYISHIQLHTSIGDLIHAYSFREARA